MRILKTLFGIYAIIIFIIVLIPAFLSYIFIFTVFGKKKSPFIAHQWISRPWSKMLFFFYGVRLKIYNSEFVNDKLPYIFIANHSSQLDIPAYAIATKQTIRFLAKKELTKIPMMGYIIKRLYIPVDRKDKEARQRSMDNMVESLHEGISVFICAEGTRNKTNDPLLPFRDGAFRLAIQSQLPLAILVVKNTNKLLSPLRPIELSPGTISCYWCKPLETKGMTEEDIPALKNHAIKVMMEMLLIKNV
jgi:1-acyl-sn-glycerol-3-phosphate acyltransferase